MYDIIVHALSVIALSLGVIPLGLLIACSGVKDLTTITNMRKTFSALAMVAMGALLVGLALVALVKGIA